MTKLELKEQLKQARQKLRQDRDTLRLREEQAATLRKRVKKHEDMIAAFEASLAEASEEPSRVSVHALFRYVERVLGMPKREDLERLVLPERYAKALTAGVTSFAVHDDDGNFLHTVKMRDGVVTTVYDKEM